MRGFGMLLVVVGFAICGFGAWRWMVRPASEGAAGVVPVAVGVALATLGAQLAGIPVSTATGEWP